MTTPGHRPLPWRQWGPNSNKHLLQVGHWGRCDCDYRRVGSPSIDASTMRLANDNVLQALGKFNGRLSQGGAVVDEDIYVISGQRRLLLSRGV